MDNLIGSYEDVVKIADEDFEEEDHPRDSDGKFASKGGGSSKKSEPKKDKKAEKSKKDKKEAKKFFEKNKKNIFYDLYDYDTVSSMDDDELNASFDELDEETQNDIIAQYKFKKNVPLYTDYATKSFNRANDYRKFRDLSPNEQEKEIKNFEFDMRTRGIDLEEIKAKQDIIDKKVNKFSQKKQEQLRNELLAVAWDTMSSSDKDSLLDEVGGDGDGWFPEEGEGTWGFDSYGLSFEDVKHEFDMHDDSYKKMFVDRLEFKVDLYDLFTFGEQKYDVTNNYKYNKSSVKQKEKELKKAQRVYKSLQKKGGSYAEAGKDLLDKAENNLSRAKRLYNESDRQMDAIKKLNKKYNTLTRNSSSIEEVYNDILSMSHEVFSNEGLDSPIEKHFNFEDDYGLARGWDCKYCGMGFSESEYGELEPHLKKEHNIEIPDEEWDYW